MTHSFWTGVFWPYFQFVVFIAVLVYFARKPIHNLLESKRNEFRTKLSEAHEALTLAERKIKQYEDQLASLTQQLETIEKQYKENAEAEQKRILDEASSAADSILSDAKRAAQELISQTQDELKDEMYKLVLKEFEKKLSPERLSALETQLQKEALSTIPQALNPRSASSNSV